MLLEIFAASLHLDQHAVGPEKVGELFAAFRAGGPGSPIPATTSSNCGEPGFLVTRNSKVAPAPMTPPYQVRERSGRESFALRFFRLRAMFARSARVRLARSSDHQPLIARGSSGVDIRANL